MVGNELGCADGCFVGKEEGYLDGSPDGCADGCEVGAAMQSDSTNADVPPIVVLPSGHNAISLAPVQKVLGFGHDDPGGYPVPW